VGAVAKLFGYNMPRNSVTKFLGAKQAAPVPASAAAPPVSGIGPVADAEAYGKMLASAAKTATGGVTLTVPRGGGIWHIAKAALAQRGVHDAYSIDHLKDMMVASPGKFGLMQNEIIPRAISSGGPWLKFGADAVIPKSVLDGILADGEKLRMAKHAARAVAKATMHIARAKVPV